MSQGESDQAIVERAGPEDWQRLRDLRLSALADAPDAFASALEEEGNFSEADWRGRLSDEDWITFFARIGETYLGLATCGLYDDAAGLYSMWVAPKARGRGLGDALVQAVVAVARAQGHSQLLLDVGDENLPAIRLYARNGFRPTGLLETLPPPRDHVKEHQRRLLLME